MHPQTSVVVAAQRVEEGLVSFLSSGRPGPHPVLQRTEPFAKGHRLVQPAQLVLERELYRIRLVDAAPGRQLACEPVHLLISDIQGHCRPPCRRTHIAVYTKFKWSRRTMTTHRRVCSRGR